MSMNSGAEKRRHSMIGTKPSFEDAPISSRLRSNNEYSREIIIAARRAPVRLLINKPYAQSSCEDDILSSSPPIPYPAVKRHRRDSWRPSLNFDKMIKYNNITSNTDKYI
uniref:Uncharacterized protein n=1 Tax=Heterorhabditis bacteriophora TaxID=37862 RepID=A0A1I7XKG2_HETBA